MQLTMEVYLIKVLLAKTVITYVATQLTNYIESSSRYHCCEIDYN